MSDPRTAPPTVPDEPLAAGGWTLAEETTETLFSLPTVRVTGHTLLYEDGELREMVRAASDGDLDMPCRFLFATRLSFLPSLAPGIGPAAVRPSVTTEARRTFATDLEDRGFRRVRRGRSQRARTDAGDRVRLTKYTARYGVEASGYHEIDIEGWLGVWIRDGAFRLAGGAYPTRGFEGLLAVLGVTLDGGPNEHRDELLELIRAVE